ncbi:transferrin-like [Calliphora vicina]|uniref:transferrin-like n=1 Tax=Calliphora vicina TaxID=7373 RepID=UPI00325AC8C7
MFKLLVAFALTALSLGQYVHSLVFRHYPQNFIQFGPLVNGQRVHNLHLCTYSDISFEKCLHTVNVARNNSIPLSLYCVRKDTRENCINSVESGNSDMVVLNAHGYKPARSAGLTPLIYAKEDDNSLYIAVVPRNITFIGVQEAPIYFDQSKHRPFHAATYFNLRMGHNICNFLNKASLTEYIKIVDSAKYVPSDDEILICPNRVPDEFENFKNCNVEAGLQRAVFVRSNLSSQQESAIRKVFETISQRFGFSSENFKFFDTFQGQDDVIFKKNTISLDLAPTYRNDVDENMFNYLHCNEDDQPHDPRFLL